MRFSAFALGLQRRLARIRTRLLVVNLLVVLVPIAGLEFARLYERQLLEALERDMQNQAVLVRSGLEAGFARGEGFGTSAQEAQLVSAAKQTRTRIRLVDAQRGMLADSHRFGPPEGKEPPAPSLTREGVARELEGSLAACADASELQIPARLCRLVPSWFMPSTASAALPLVCHAILRRCFCF